MGILSYKDKHFLMDGEKHTILSGAIHYFRVVPEYWEDRLKKLRACGFNTVETYVCWNLHEPREDEFDFSGMLDLSRFLQTAGNLGLDVILRPGPYICAEWEFGGLPSWLLSYPRMRLRCADPLYLEKVERFFERLFQEVRPHLSTNGGNVVAVQIENEYGSYGDDKEYLGAIVEIYRRCGVDCLLFTSDGPTWFMLNGGSLPDYLATANFGSRPGESFRLLREFRPGQPDLCCEYWNGWFDHWYEEHHIRESDDTAETFDQMLELGASVNFYMFHGGTNFGFTNGANHDKVYQPTVTSYDYNCLLSENGDRTPKYYAVKKVMEDRFGPAPALEVGELPRRAYGAVPLTEAASLFGNLEALSRPVSAPYPMTMEELGQSFGFVLYSTRLRGPFEELELVIDGLHDRALIYLDGAFRGVKERTGRRDDVVKIRLGQGEEARLDILVENMGRVNYGPRLRDEKGILGGVRLGQQFHFGWTMYPLPCCDLSGLSYGEATTNAYPAFLRGHLEVAEPCDTFVRLEGFTKGMVYVNGFNLGRYWNAAGPQKTLYLPAPLLHKGGNEIVVLELEGFEGGKPAVRFTDQPDLG